MYFSSFMSVFFAYGGAFLPKSISNKFESAFALVVKFLFAIFVLGYVVGFANTPIIQRKIEILLQASGFVFFFSMHLLIRYHRVKLVKCVPKLQSLPPEIFGDDFTFPAETTVRNVLLEMLKVFLLPFAIFTMYSFPISPFIELVWEAEDNYILPHWYTCSSTTSSLYRLSFLCVYVDNYWRFFAFNVVQVVVVVALFHFYFLSTAFYVITINSLDIIAQKLIHKVKVMSQKMEHGSQMLVVGKDDSVSRLIRMPVSEMELREDFIGIVKCHQYLQRLVLRTVML